jgi:hypothetical protein
MGGLCTSGRGAACAPPPPPPRNPPRALLPSRGRRAAQSTSRHGPSAHPGPAAPAGTAPGGHRRAGERGTLARWATARVGAGVRRGVAQPGTTPAVTQPPRVSPRAHGDPGAASWPHWPPSRRRAGSRPPEPHRQRGASRMNPDGHPVLARTGSGCCLCCHRAGNAQCGLCSPRLPAGPRRSHFWPERG